VLLESERAVQQLGGGRVTFCKSGKDRTAMSVTLEESLMLVERHLVRDVTAQRQRHGCAALLNAMRQHLLCCESMSHQL
jgi:hypothetical protein